MKQFGDRSGALQDGRSSALTASAARIEGIDVLRGIALLGLPIMNVVAFAMPVAAYLNPTVYSSSSDPTSLMNHLLFSFNYLFADQKFMGLFTLLFGASVGLLAERSSASERHPAAVHYLRNFWLIVIGFCHGWYLWDGDVLLIYGAIAFLIYPLLQLETRHLTVLAIVSLLLSSWLLDFDDVSAASIGADARAELQWLYSPDSIQIDKQLAIYRGSYGDITAALRPAEEGGVETTAGSDVLLEYGYALVLRIFGMMSLGLAMFRSGLFHIGDGSGPLSLTHRRLLTAGIFIALPLGLSGAAFGLYWNYSNAWNIDAYFGFGQLPLDLSAMVQAPGYACLILLMLRRGLLRPVQSRLALVGRMALTNYLTQTLICVFLFYGYGLGLYGSLSRAELLPVVGLIWTLQILWSKWWLTRFRSGPVEWLWRIATKGRVGS